MSAITDLNSLLKSLAPIRVPGSYAYLCLDYGSPAIAELAPAAIAQFREAEGLTLIVDADLAATHSHNILFRCAWIRLEVNSALDAVGLTAAVSSALGTNGISCNVIAASHHDHLFVPLDDADKALRVLSEVQQAALSAEVDQEGGD